MPVKVPESGRLGYITIRRELEDQGVIQNGQFVRDYAFSSPSRASAVVLGRSASDGRLAWKSEDGTPLGELLA